MKLPTDVKILYSTIVIVLVIFTGSHISPNLAIRTDLFLNGYFIKSMTTKISKYKTLYYSDNPSLTYSCKQKFGIWYIDNKGDP